MASGAEKYNQIMKLIVIGDSGTGKSCLLHRFLEDTFSEDQTQTIGVEFGAKIVQLLGKRIKLQIWDTAGQERYKSVTRSYYRGAVGCLIVYDITSKSSFEHVQQWLADVKQLAGEGVTVMIVGNKSDLDGAEKRQISHNEGSLFAQQEGLMHFETSAATGELVTEAFLKVAKTALQRAGVRDSEEESAGVGGPSNNTVNLSNDPTANSDGSGYSCAC